MIKNISFLILVSLSIFQMSFAFENTPVPEDMRYQTYGRIYALGGSLISFGMDYYITRSWWAGGNLGISLFPTYNNSKIVFNPSVSLETGVHIIGNIDNNIKSAVGATATLYFMIPQKHWDSISDNPAIGFWAGPFIEFSWKFLYLRAYVVFDINAQQIPSFFPSMGIRF